MFFQSNYFTVLVIETDLVVLHCPLLITYSNCTCFQGVSLQTRLLFVTALRAAANSRLGDAGSQYDQTSATFISNPGDESKKKKFF